MKVDGNKIGFMLGGSIELEKAHLRAKEHKVLYHYTNYDSLSKILSSMTLKFNRSDSVNDLEEEKYYKNDIYKSVFLSSLVYKEKESIPMWSIYTNNENGVRIGFHSNKGEILKSIIDNQRNVIGVNGSETKNVRLLKSSCIRDEEFIDGWFVDIDQTDIIYDESFIEKDPINYNDKYYSITSMGVVKSDSWDYENESRFLAFLRTTRNEIQIPEFNFLLVPIHFNNLDKIDITFSPFMSEETKKKIKKDVEELHELCEIVFSVSELQNKIKRK